MRTADGGTEFNEVVIRLGTSGAPVSVRLVFRDPDPEPGRHGELWEAQRYGSRGYGTDPLTAAAAALNAAEARRRVPG